jgi:uncharacterized protein with HEPN domain
VRIAQGPPMTRDPQRLPDYLGHILQAIQRIERYVGSADEAAFLVSEIVQDAVIRNLEVIGEASRNIERTHPDYAVAHPELPLKLAGDMRNALSHGYFKIDLQIVWKTIQHELPRLKAVVQSLLSDGTI